MTKPRSRWMWMCCALAVLASTAHAQLPNAKPVPAVQVMPLPYGQASFTWHGRELTRYHFGPSVQHPFWFPMNLFDGRSLTRIGHPHAPYDHRHHESVWVAHMNVDGISFWEHDNGQRIVCKMVHEFGDGDDAAWMISENQWMTGNRVVLREMRRCEVRPIDEDQWMMIIDIEFKSPDNKPVELKQSYFGLIGVRMAKTIGVNDGGGRILDANGHHDEKQVFHQPTRWVDYSGPVSLGPDGIVISGITLMDHPSNPGFPALDHVRDDGWMGVCTTGKEPITIQPGGELHYCYGLWVHGGAPDAEAIDRAWKQFSELRPAALKWK